MLFWIQPSPASRSSHPRFVLAKVRSGVNRVDDNRHHVVITGIRGPPEGSSPSVTLLQERGGSYFRGMKLIWETMFYAFQIETKRQKTGII